jgi:predicted GH43/DUF377 family glycosyl hydrolase
MRKTARTLFLGGFTMKRLLLLILIGLCFGTMQAQDDDDGLFTPIDEPIVRRGAAGDWDDRFTDPGAVLYHDGMFHMFRNGFRGWPASVQIGYLTSQDGITWTEAQEDPVLFTDDVPYAGTAALASSVLVEEDGTWVLYFYTWAGAAADTTSSIGRATADDPLGPWTVDAEPVLSPGSEGAWDSRQVMQPKVLQTDDGYVMYYSAVGTDLTGVTGQIGMATSPDGVTWTKYDDPDTTDTLYAESDPITLVDEGRLVSRPNVMQTPDGWVMLFRSADASTRRDHQVRAAASDDGITWTASATPLFTLTSLPGLQGFWYTAAEYVDGTYYLYIEIGRRGFTDIIATTYEGNLPE